MLIRLLGIISCFALIGCSGWDAIIGSDSGNGSFNLPSVPAPSVDATLELFNVGTNSYGSDMASMLEGEATHVRVTIVGGAPIDGTVTLCRAGSLSAGDVLNSNIFTSIQAVAVGAGSFNLDLSPINDAAVEGVEVLNLRVCGSTGFAVSDSNTISIAVMDVGLPPGPDQIVLLRKFVSISSGQGDNQIEAENALYGLDFQSLLPMRSAIRICSIGEVDLDADYQGSIEGWWEIPAGVTQHFITFRPQADGVAEGLEASKFWVCDAKGFNLLPGQPRADVTLLDDPNPATWPAAWSFSSATGQVQRGGSINVRINFSKITTFAGTIELQRIVYGTPSFSLLTCTVTSNSIVQVPAGVDFVTFPLSLSGNCTELLMVEFYSKVLDTFEPPNLDYFSAAPHRIAITAIN